MCELIIISFVGKTGSFNAKHLVLSWSFHSCRRYLTSIGGCLGPSLWNKQQLHSTQDEDFGKDRVSALMEGNGGEGFHIDVGEDEWHNNPKNLGNA